MMKNRVARNVTEFMIWHALHGSASTGLASTDLTVVASHLKDCNAKCRVDLSVMGLLPAVEVLTCLSLVCRRGKVRHTY